MEYLRKYIQDINDHTFFLHLCIMCTYQSEAIDKVQY